MLGTEQRETLERDVRALCHAGEHAKATTRTLEGYGPEVLGYLVAVTRSESDAGDAFSLFSEDLWRGLPAFRWDASLRTWVYTLARHAAYRLRRDPHRRADRRVPLSQSPELYQIAQRVRTSTLQYLRTEVKDEVAELRRELEPEDQHLIVLRVGRKMSWLDIARVLDDDAATDHASLKRAAARLRKRFERAKNQLAILVRERGIGRSGETD